MSGKKIQTNLIGRKVRLTDEALEWPRWHTNKGTLWKYEDVNDLSTGVFLGNYGNVPGGKDGTAEIVVVHLDTDNGLVAAIKWEANGEMITDLKIEHLQILPEDSND